MARRRAAPPYSSTLHALSARRLTIAWLVCASLVAAACGTTVDSPTTATDEASPGGEFGDLPPGDLPEGARVTKSGKVVNAQGEVIGTAEEFGIETGGGTGGSSTSGGTGGGGAAASGGGTSVTKKEPVKVAFIVLRQGDANRVAGSAGVNFVDQGDADEQVKAITEHVNATGGIAGHKMESVIVERSASEEEAAGEARCRNLTEDEHVFAVIANGGTAPECYAKRQTLVVATQSFDRFTLDQGAPYLWIPGLPVEDAGYAAQVKGLADQGYFKDPQVKVGIGAWDDPGTHKAFDNVVKPWLKRYYDGPIDIQYVSTEGDRYSQESQQMAVRFKSEGITHVFFMAPGAGVPLFFMQAARAQGYYPMYGLSTYDNPILLATARQSDQLANSMGVGWTTGVDIDDQHGPPYPQGAAEKRCEAALKREDAGRPSRSGALYAGYYCDGAFMLQDAAKMVDGPLTTTSWAAAANRLQDRFQATWSFPGTTYFEPGKRAGGTTHRYFDYKLDCQCFVYVSKPKRNPIR